MIAHRLKFKSIDFDYACDRLSWRSIVFAIGCLGDRLSLRSCPCVLSAFSGVHRMAFTRLSNSTILSPLTQPLAGNSGLLTDQVSNNPYSNSNIVNPTTTSSTAGIANASITNVTNKAFTPPPTSTPSPEIFWRNYVTGEMRTWQVINGNVANIQTLPTVSDFSWQLEATVDFDRDGDTDLLWRNQRSGAVLIWQMQAGQIVASPFLQASGDNRFTIVGVADFNQDGWADLLSFNYQTGESEIWQMKGVDLVGKAKLPTITDMNWRIKGIGDLNGDQAPDILWQHTNGSIVYWQINQAQMTGASLLPTPHPNWSIVGLEDLDLDGDLDFLWRHNQTGNMVIWQMQNQTIQTGFFVGGIQNYGLNQDWRLEQVGDFDRDGDYDVLWHNPSTGGTGLWLLDKTSLQAIVPLKTELQSGWKIEEVLV